MEAEVTKKELPPSVPMKRRDFQPPRRDILDAVKEHARRFVENDFLEPAQAERKAIEGYLKELATDAEFLVETFGREADVLRQRLEARLDELPFALSPSDMERLADMRRRAHFAEQKLKQDLAPTVPDEEFNFEEAEPEESVEDVVEVEIETWRAIDLPIINRQVKVETTPATPEGVQPLEDRVRALIGLIKAERAKIASVKEPTKQEVQALRLYQLELRDYQADAKEEIASKELVEFLSAPQAEVEQRLRRGERHPRLLERVAAEERRQYMEARTKHRFDVRRAPRVKIAPEAVAKRLMPPAEAQMYDRLREGTEFAKAPVEVRDLLLQASGQMENNYPEEAAKTLETAIQLLRRVDEAQMREQLVADKEYLESRVVDVVAETMNLSAQRYEAIMKEQPERAEAIAERMQMERTLREGPILNVMVVKSVNGGRRGATVEDLQGVDKVMMLRVGVLDERGEQVLREDGSPETIMAIAKSSINEGHMRRNVDPSTSTRLEWQAALEAVELGSDLIPATVMRKEGLPVEMSIQQMVRGERKGAVSAANTPDWEKVIPRQQLEEAAVLDILQFAQDSGEPNYVITEEGAEGAETKRLHLIDRGLSQPLDGQGNFMSCATAAIGGSKVEGPGRQLSAETAQKLERYRDRLPMVAEALRKIVRYDVGELMRAKERRLSTLLRGEVGDYDDAYAGNWEMLRDDGRFEKEYREAPADEMESVQPTVVNE